MATPHKLKTRDVPHASLQMSCTNTFTSVLDARVQLSHPVYVTDAVCKAGLEAFGKNPHRCRFFCIDDHPIIAVKYGLIQQLGSTIRDNRFCLPRELFARMHLTTRSSKLYEFEGYLVSETLDLPHHQAFFVVTSRDIEWFDEVLDWKLDDPEYNSVKFNPHINSFTYHSQLQTVNLLDTATATPWHPVLLNQSIDSLPITDMTAGIDPEKVAEADHWLRNFRGWNSEQLQVIDGIHHIKGRIMIVMGVAGTGKTLLMSALANYFAMLGIQAGLFPPANSNADHSIKSSVALAAEVNPRTPLAGDLDGVSTTSNETNEETSNDDLNEVNRALGGLNLSSIGNKKIRAHRLYPSSRNYGFEHLSPAQARHHTVGHHSRAVSSLKGFEFKNKSFKDRKAGVRDLAIESGLREEAFKGELSFEDELFQDEGEIDIWEVLREHMLASDEGKFDWDNERHVSEYERNYEACKGHLVAITDIVVTTSGNVRCSELTDHFKQRKARYGMPSNGFALLLDEAAKDLEINTWMPIMLAGDQARGAILFGDDKQLAPTNVSATDKVQFNIYSDRLSKSLPLRLIAEGFPYISLKEQQRMHPCLFEFPNEEFYNNTSRNGPTVDVTLEHEKPGLAKVLHGIVAKSLPTLGQARLYRLTATDEQARHHYIEVGGERDFQEDSNSAMVPNHLNVFFKHIFPDLEMYFKEKTKENLMIICAYGWAVSYQHLHRISSRIANAKSTSCLTMRRDSSSFANSKILPDAWYPSLALQRDSDPMSGSVPVPVQTESTDTQPTSNGVPTAFNSHEDGSTDGNEHATQEEEPRFSTGDFYSRILTIDSAQGQESFMVFMVFMDGSFQHPSGVGFMKDPGRCNVAMTRAKGVFWMIGGPMEVRHWSTEDKVTPFVKLKAKMEGLNRVHKFSP